MKRAFYVVLLSLMIASTAAAQDKPSQEKPSPEVGALRPPERPLSYYKLEFILREMQDGKVLNSRTYLMTVENTDRAEAKTGARVPVSLGGSGTPGPIQYMDVGVNITCRVNGRDDYASLRTTIEISSFALPEQATVPGTQPVVRSMRTDMAAVVPVNKQTVIGAIDDVNSTKRYEIAVTATKMK
jgi:hypothetical protein